MKHFVSLSRALVTGALVLLAAGCVSPEAHRRVIGANQKLQAEIDQARKDLGDLAQENQRLRAQVSELGKNALDASFLAEQKRKLAALLQKYDASAPTSVSDVEMVQTGEGLAFRVAGGVLFASGSNVLTAAGKKKLDELVSDLRGRRIRVEGHTDDTKIQHSQWGTNLRLSMERAMSVADYLTQTAGLDPANISVAGYGEFRPAQIGTDDAAREKNRRVEILLLEH